MIRFFRNLRHRLLAENQVSRYLLYALGEIVLVVIGILIALQINTWNEDRQQQSQFYLGLEQAYNSIDLATESVGRTIHTGDAIVRYIDLLLDRPEEIPDWKLPYLLFFADQGLHHLGPETLQGTAPGLVVNPNDFEQIKLAKEVTSYFERTIWGSPLQDSLVTPLLYEAGIPIPIDNYGITMHEDFNSVDHSFFTPEELSIARSMVPTDRVRKALRSTRASLQVLCSVNLANTLEEGKSVMRSIKLYHPEVRLLYSDVRILGTSLNGYESGQSVPMSLRKGEENIWEADLALKDGTVKFRTGESWRQNWGGSSFPEGPAMFYWSNIPVRAGRYHISLNLADKTYRFARLPE